MFNFVVSFKLKINLDVMDKRKFHFVSNYGYFFLGNLRVIFFNKDNLVILDLLK